jgi:hypothetical protein
LKETLFACSRDGALQHELFLVCGQYLVKETLELRILRDGEHDSVNHQRALADELLSAKLLEVRKRIDESFTSVAAGTDCCPFRTTNAALFATA